MDKYSESVSATLTAIKNSKIRSKREKLIENLLNMTLNHFDRVARFKLADLLYLDDVLSMMYRKAILYIDSYDGVSNGYGWMYTILVKTIYTVNLAVKKYRDHEVCIDDIVEPSANDNGVLRVGIMLALESADEIDRDIILMYYYEDMSIREIGEKLNLSKSAISYRKTRAEQHIKYFFENYYRHALDN